MLTSLEQFLIHFLFAHRFAFGQRHAIVAWGFFFLGHLHCFSTFIPSDSSIKEFTTLAVQSCTHCWFAFADQTNSFLCSDCSGNLRRSRMFQDVTSPMYQYDPIWSNGLHVLPNRLWWLCCRCQTFQPTRGLKAMWEVSVANSGDTDGTLPGSETHIWCS